MQQTATMARDFERESHRIDQLVWDAMALRAGETALFCGFANNREWIVRAAGIGVAVSVISDDADAIREARALPVGVIRGSTSILPARDLSFDATIAFHYLHEVDPLFHANIVSELARAGKRCVIVEPAPPSDPLGLRIASLYSRAKRQLGQFENYNQLDYWRKLLAIVKPDVRCQTFTFLRTPPPEAARDTVTLLIDTMAAEETPEPYLAELRALAARDDAQILPQARYVIVGTTPGSSVAGTVGGTPFREIPLEVSPPAANVKPFVPPAVSRTERSKPAAPTVYNAADVAPEFPAVPQPDASRAAAAPAESIDAIARNAFGLGRTVAPAPAEPLRPAPAARPPEPAPADPADSFGWSDTSAREGFDSPGAGDEEIPAEFGWTWEPPDGQAGE